MRTRIKICGLTREVDMTSAVNAGADAVGFVFHPASKRNVSADRAAELTRNMPAFISSVALFVNPEPQTVRSVIGTMRPTLLQFHGDESPEFCRAFGMPYLKAFRVGAPGIETADSLAQFCQNYPDANGWLFDSYTPAYGGSGHGFDHDLLVKVRGLNATERAPLVLSGGLTVKNLANALQNSGIWAVDVSSGVEDAPGIKSADKITAFVAAVKSADEQLALTGAN